MSDSLEIEYWMRHLIRKFLSGIQLLNLLKLTEKSTHKEAYMLFSGISLVVTFNSITLPMAAFFEFMFPILYRSSYFRTYA